MGVLRPLAAIVVLAALAVPSAQGASNITLTFLSVTTVSQPHDTKPVGKYNAGDSIDFKDLLVNKADQLGKKKGKAAAYDAGTILYTSATSQKIGGVMTVPGYGTVTFEGPMVAWKDHKTIHVPVIKGTGAFKGVKGTLIMGQGDQQAPNTYVLTLPKPLAGPGSA